MYRYLAVLAYIYVYILNQNISVKENLNIICQHAGRIKNMKLTYGEKSCIALAVYLGKFATSSVISKKGQDAFYHSLGAQNCITGWCYAQL